jgi:rhodanese-related sulfurtransferase
MIKLTSIFTSLTMLLVLGFLGVFGSYGWSMGRQAYKNISVAQFVRMMNHKDFTLINVHIPYEGEIEGTDLLIPFNKIDHFKNQLPADKAARVVVYCLMGPMGSVAAENLVSMGYTQVMHLEGGLMAWENFGREVFNRYAERKSSRF